jgi:uncharacterized phage protein gp47/JayE
VLEKKNYREIAADILTQICGGQISETLTFDPKSSLYSFKTKPVADIKVVEGVFNGSKKLFMKGTDYELAGNSSIEWLVGGSRPDVGSLFTVTYLYVSQSGISDVNIGSVVRTLVEAISREIEYLYLQTEQAYLAGFIDTANGQALDFVVSLLGIQRKPPQPAMGSVTFGRTSEPELIIVTGETHLWDGATEYLLSKPLSKEVLSVKGSCQGVHFEFLKDHDFSFIYNSIRWLPDGKKPDDKTVFSIDYTAYRQIIVPKGTAVTTLPLKQAEVRVFKTLEAASLALSLDGRWEADVAVVAAEPGRIGNVLAGSVVVMPMAISGVEYVINKGDLVNGVEAETDVELRERAKHALEFAGKATLVSLESAIRSVEGVSSIYIEDKPDDVAGIVKVIVDGGNLDEMKRVIDDTRAAGVKVEVFRPQIVYINFSFTLQLKKDAQPLFATAEAEKRVRSYISSLGIGKDVLFSRLMESLVSFDSVWDVKDISIRAQRSDGSVVESTLANIIIKPHEMAAPRIINVSFERRS